MRKVAMNRFFNFFMPISVSLVCIFISPWNSVDPVNLPKLFLLIIVGFIAGGYAVSRLDLLKTIRYRFIVTVAIVFLIQLIVVFVTDDRDSYLKLYGTNGRNTGILAYVSLTFILVATALIASNFALRIYQITFLICGSIVGIYGIFQSIGMDVYEYNNAYASNVFGPFGNANFQSAFMGMVAALSLTTTVFSRSKIQVRTISFLIAVVAIYNITKSSDQGFLILLVGFGTAIVLYFYHVRKILWSSILASLIFLSGILVSLGIYNRGPLSTLIFDTSLQARTYYWQVARQAIVSNPLSGLGLDAYSDYYRRYRTPEMAEFYKGVVSDSAHSIPLDIGAGGGLPLLLAYLGIVLLAMVSIYRVSKRLVTFNVTYASFVAAWVSYQIQSLISINQLGLGVWGWSLTGLLIGYELNTREPKSRETSIKRSELTARQELKSNQNFSPVLILGIIGIVVATPPYSTAGKFYKALQTQNAVEIQKAAYIQPYDRGKFLIAAGIMNQNKLDSYTLSLLKDATKLFPDSLDFWELWISIPTATKEDVAKAKIEMKRLDPFNPDLK
jgi:O-antigen ligase